MRVLKAFSASIKESGTRLRKYSAQLREGESACSCEFGVALKD
jgi:hypothetical protein